VATASLANVYAATLPDGERVAVKIQQRTVARFLAVDLWTIEQFYALLSFLVPNLRLGWLADETRRHMGEELDFVAERRNALEAAAMLASEFPPSMLVIPATHAHLCGRRVLTMAWVDGVRLDDQPGLEAQGTDKRAVAALLQRLFASMIFLHGFVHCDPHPGNILVTPTGQLALLDHGIYRRLPDELRTSYAQLWLAVLSGSPDAIRARTAALGVDPTHWRFISLIVALSPGEAADSLLEGDGGERAMAALSLEERAETARRLLALTGGVAAQSQLFESLPPDLLLILKANNLLRHANEALGSPVNRFRVALPYASRGAGVRPSLRARLGACLAPLAARMERGWRRRAPQS
jgi:aarF domain-containing kinase